MTTRRSFIAAVPSLALLAGCGFHLRGTMNVPVELSPLYIQAAAGSPVKKAIEDQLSGRQLALTPDPAKAKLTLRILSETRASRVVATGSAGKVLASELRYVVVYEAVAADGKSLVPKQTLDLSRTFDNPDVEVLGKQLEEAQIYQEFAVDAADRILLRLRAVLRASGAK